MLRPPTETGAAPRVAFKRGPPHNAHDPLEPAREGEGVRNEQRCRFASWQPLERRIYRCPYTALEGSTRCPEHLAGDAR